MPAQSIEIAVTATAQAVDLVNSARHTIRNAGPARVYYRASANTAAFAGLAAALLAAADGYLDPGQSVRFGGDETAVVLACATGLTATVVCVAGDADDYAPTTVMKDYTVTAGAVALEAAAKPGKFRIWTGAGNAGNVTFVFATMTSTWPPGTWADVNLDLHLVTIQGTAGDAVTVVGG